jgi:hypothetical protein
VQSPNDYRFLRNVINQNYPYYKYDDLKMSVKCQGIPPRKICQLYFRLANWRQPTVIESDAYWNYFQAGCKKATFGESSELIRMMLDGDYRQQLAFIYNKVKDDTVLIVEGLWRNRSFWKEVKADERAVVTFDLYYCGIVLFDKKRQKQNYIINF